MGLPRGNITIGHFVTGSTFRRMVPLNISLLRCPSAQDSQDEASCGSHDIEYVGSEGLTLLAGGQE